MQEAKNHLQGEAMLLSQRQHNPLIGGCGLQLEIKGRAKAFSQGEAPGPIDASAEGCMENQLHTAGFVKKALSYDGVLSRYAAKHGATACDIRDNLLRTATIQPAFRLKPGLGGI